MVCVVQTYDPPHPTYPLVRSVTTGDDAGSGVSSHVITLPTGIDAGDRVIILFATRETPDATWPAGWSEFYDGGNSGQIAQAGAYRDCDGTEGGTTITVTTGATRACAWHVWWLSRGNFIAGVAPEAGAVATGSSTTPDPPTVAPSWGASVPSLLITAVSLKNSAAPPTVSSWPTNYTDNQTQEVGSGVNHALHAASRQASTASENPGTFTLSGSEQWAAQTIAVRIAS